jgi:hypothetical protein
MNVLHLLDGQTPLVLSVLTSYVIPYLAALAVKAPSWAQHAVTVLLASASAFLAEWAANPNHFDWKQGAGLAVVNFVFAFVVHKAALGERADGRVPRPAAFLYSHGLQLRGGGVHPDSGTHTEGS